MLFQPIALEEQAKDLLRAGQYEQALGLANVCALHGAPWVETAFAQAALLLLNGDLMLITQIHHLSCCHACPSSARTTVFPAFEKMFMHRHILLCFT